MQIPLQIQSSDHQISMQFPCLNWLLFDCDNKELIENINIICLPANGL